VYRRTGNLLVRRGEQQLSSNIKSIFVGGAVHRCGITWYVGIETEPVESLLTVKAIRQLTVIITDDYLTNDMFVRQLTAAIRQMITYRVW
jgi:hypothetical protein